MLELGKDSNRFNKNLKHEIEDNKNKIGTIKDSIVISGLWFILIVFWFYIYM